MNITTGLFNEIQTPIIVLSTRWHKHLGVIENIDKTTISFTSSLSSADEFSFDVYKYMDENLCSLWENIIDFKFIYVPQHNAYYEIQVSLDESDTTIKHVTAKAACEAELDQRMLRNFECNTEDDIKRDDYDVNYPTVFYRENPAHQDASLLHRVLHDKCQDYKIIHVDSTLKNIQRTFSADNDDIYSFLTGDVAEEIGCLFLFDSVERGISAYDLKCNCLDCGNRGEWEKECPECKSTNCTYGFGKFTQIFISAENFAQSLSIEGDADSVKNCFRIEGGDDYMTATVANINPNGSFYIYRFSDFMLNDMPEELKNKIISYNATYEEKYPDYKQNAERLYNAIDERIYLTSKMMPEIIIPSTTAAEEYEKAKDWLQNNKVAVTNIKSLSKTSADLAVKGMATALVNANYKVEVAESTLSDADGSTRTWNGHLIVTNTGNEDDKAEGSYNFDVTISNENYEMYVRQKIQKVLDRKDNEFNEVFNIKDMDEFKRELKKYCLDSLNGFESSYNAILEVLIEQGVTKDSEDFFGVDLYKEIYLPYYERLVAIQEEAKVRQAEIDVVSSREKECELYRDNIQDELNFQKYIGDDLWKIFNSYLREDTYSNSNYISDGLDNSEVIKKAEELFNVAKDEIYKSSELQLSLSSTLNDLMLHKEFINFRDNVDLGNWIVCKVDNKLYRLRIVDISFDYGSPENISITFSNVTKYKDYASDINDLLNRTSSMTSSFGFVAHQAEQGNNVANDYNRWVEEGLDSATVMIKNNDKEEITYDEHGIIARTWDDILDDYAGEQLKITHNCLAFTEDSWKTSSAALGKHQYVRYDSTTDKFVRDVGYGLTSKFVTAGNVYGTDIIGGNIYSSNYSDGTKVGTHIDLLTGSFSFAGGKLRYNSTNDTINYSGSITMTGGNLDVKNASSQTLFKADVDNKLVTLAGFTVTNNAIYNGTSSISSTGVGVYIGTDGFRNYKDATHHVTITNGGITANSGTFTNVSISSATISNCTIDVASIPNLSASKITSGTINAAVVAVTNLNASNITSGTIATARLSSDVITSSNISTVSLSADQITSGTIDANNITVKNINGANIKAGTITASSIKAGTITADRFEQTSGGSMNLGSSAYVSGTFYSGTLQNGTVTISSNGTLSYSASGQTQSINIGTLISKVKNL